MGGLEFSEAQEPWRTVPNWASFLIEFGFAWLAQPRLSRRIAVISMPADSAGAGLVALGAMRKCLELENANDLSSHYERLLDLARRRPDGVTLRHSTFRGVFIPDGIGPDGLPWAKQNSESGLRFNIPSALAPNWRVNGEAPVAILKGQTVPNSQFYAHMVQHGGVILPTNFSQSHSQVCLAGRGAGESPTRDSIVGIRFRQAGAETDLSQLLTVQTWLPGTISRVMFYNSRTEEFDRQAGRPQLVIADGDTSFLKVVDRVEFEQSDAIGIIHRTIERQRLEAIGTKLENLRQWYDRVPDWVSHVPRGVGVAVLIRRPTRV